MSRIWLDVTTLLGWRRPAVGVVRVESECAKAALAAGDDMRFCRFDRATGFHVVEAAQVHAALARLSGEAAQSEASRGDGNAASAPPVALSTRVKRLVLRVLERLPVRLADAIRGFLTSRKEAIRAGLRGLRELRTAVLGMLRPQPPAAPAPQTEAPVRAPIPFAAGDVYVSLGLDWDQKDLVYLYEQKTQTGFKALLFCYDIIPVKLPHLCVGDVASHFALYFVNVAWCADRVACISRRSMEDLRSLLAELGAPIPDMTVVRLGSDLPAQQPDAAASSGSSPPVEPYILYVSTIERRKNHETLYKAYTRLVEQGVQGLPKLVFVGMPGWGVGDLMADLRLDPRVKDLIVCRDWVDDAELARFYRGALFTVFPSLYEGWGLAVAESLAHGKFCLASNAASIPEVGEDFVEYVDPWDVPQWAERLRFYIENAAAREAREQDIRRRYRPVLWKDSAAGILNEARRLLTD